MISEFAKLFCDSVSGLNFIRLQFCESPPFWDVDRLDVEPPKKAQIYLFIYFTLLLFYSFLILFLQTEVLTFFLFINIMNQTNK